MASVVHIAVPGAIDVMESASSRFFEALRHVSVKQLKELKPTKEYIPLVEAMIDMRLLMEPATTLRKQGLEI